MVFVIGNRLAIDDAAVDRRAVAQGIGQVVAPGINRVERQGERKRQGQGDADQDVHPTPQPVGDRVVAMPRDNKHGNRREQRGVTALADGMVGEESADHGHREIGQPRHPEPRLLRHQQQADASSDQGADGAFGGFFADIAVMLQAADHHQHRHRRPLTVGQVDAGGQQDRCQQPQRHTHRVDHPGVAIAPIRVE